MRFIISFIILILTSWAHAQTVEKVTEATATVTLQGSEVLSVGEKVSFLNDFLNVTGQGEVTQVSEGGRRALVKITSGDARPGMTLEKTSPPVSVPAKTATERDADATIVPRDNYDSPNSRYFSDEDRRVLRNGEIGDVAYIAGGVFSVYPGFGVGHAIQGRYLDKGWIFTAGEFGSLGLIVAGAGDCLSRTSPNQTCSGGGAIALGAIGYLGFRIWEILDAWFMPPVINNHYRSLRTQMYKNALQPVLAPTKDGAVAGLQLTF